MFPINRGRDGMSKKETPIDSFHEKIQAIPRALSSIELPDFFHFIDKARFAINFVDKNGVIVYANQEAQQSRIIPPEFIGRSLYDLKKYGMILNPAAIKVIESGKGHIGEVTQYSGRTFMSITFPVINDDIGSRLIFYRLSNLRGSLASPLADVKETPAYVNLGSKWYVIYYITDNVGCKVIGGLEIKDNFYSDVNSAENGVNPELRLPSNYFIMPVSYDGGSTVCLDSEPMFKVIAEARPDMPPVDASMFRWLALVFFTVSVVLYLTTHKSARIYFFVLAVLFGMTATAYFWGLRLQNSVSFFSPNVYADGHLFYSFGSLLIVNTYIFLYILCTYIMRNVFIRNASRGRWKYSRVSYYVIISTFFILTAAYIHFSLKSLILNSNISLELYAWNSISMNTLWVYVSYTSLLLALLMLVQLLKPVVSEIAGLRYNVFSRRFLFVYAGICALYFTLIAGPLKKALPTTLSFLRLP